jgi:hypothetical protein
MEIILACVLLVITSCSSSETAYVIKETTQEKYVPQEPSQIAPAVPQAIPPAPKPVQPTTYTAFAGETITFQGKQIHIEDTGTLITFSTPAAHLNLQEKENGTLENITILLANVSRERKESTGYVQFWYSLGKKTNLIMLGEQETRAFKDTQTHTISLAFLGTSNNKAAAIFIVNGQRTKPLEEKDSFYFKDGSVIFVDQIMQRTSARIILATHVTFEVSP